jgi:restriction endonuclease S subunit
MQKVKINDVLKYEQPTKYIVETENYNNDFKTPVLTAGKSFILGYTNEVVGIFNDVPAIIFDDFTTAFHYVDFPFKVKSSAMKILNVVKEKADLKYLFYKMQTISIDKDLHKRYWISKYSQIQIPLPDLLTQKKIAKILDKADELRQYNKQLIEKYDALTQSLFLDMFGDPVTNEKRWKTKTIEELTKKEKGSIKRGPFGGALKKEIFVEEGYLVYEQFHALNNDFSMARYFINQEKFNELKGFEVKSGDIIISCSGVYLGKLAIVPQNAKKGIINQALLKVTLDENVMRNDFFIFHFTHKNFREKYFDANRGAGIPNFPPMSDFKKFPFISPSIELQHQFTKRIQMIEAQKKQAQEALAKSEDLFQSLLQRAFKGELN